MFDRILIPLGLEERNETVVEAVRALAHSKKPNITLLHVIQTVENIPFGDLEDFYKSIEAKAQAFLRDIEETFGEMQVPSQAAIVYGNRVKEILDYAEKDASDLIMMTSHRVEAHAPAKGWNSISHTIAIFSPCPVLLLK